MSFSEFGNIAPMLPVGAGDLGTRFRSSPRSARNVDFVRLPGEGDARQRWIDDNLPTCPMCREQSLWKVASGVDQEALVRWYFQCPNCKVVLSTIPDTAVSAIAEPVNVVKAAVEVNLRVDSVERKADEDFLGEEFPLYELQEWAEENES